MEKRTCVIFCRCGAGLNADRELRLAETLKGLPADVYELHDLCGFSLNEKEFLENIGREYAHKIIVACYPRAVKCLFIQNKISFGSYEVINLREEPENTVAGKIRVLPGMEEGRADYTVKISGLKVPSWYPVVDTSRCTLCGQCSRFCLFGVYRFDKKSLSVVSPLSCKNNCPACGRACPSSAIIFPKVPEASILAGAEPYEAQEVIRSGSNSVLFEKLRERNKNRKSIFESDLVKLAEEEKQKVLEELKKQESKKDL
jgi:NAD-dependent dihydropyrimidine dehydrogenase PreA subunit